MKTQTEPAALSAMILSILGVTFVLIKAFFPDFLTDVQEAAITGFLVIVLPLIAGWVVRGQVTPNARVVEYTAEHGVTVLAGEANELETDSFVREIATS